MRRVTGAGTAEKSAGQFETRAHCARAFSGQLRRMVDLPKTPFGKGFVARKKFQAAAANSRNPGIFAGQDQAGAMGMTAGTLRRTFLRGGIGMMPALARRSPDKKLIRGMQQLAGGDKKQRRDAENPQQAQAFRCHTAPIANAGRIVNAKLSGRRHSGQCTKIDYHRGRSSSCSESPLPTSGDLLSNSLAHVCRVFHLLSATPMRSSNWIFA